MAGERTVPGLDLTAYWTPGSDGWDTGMDANLSLLSAVTHLTVLDRLATLPSTPSHGDIYILTTDNSVQVYDTDQWVSYTPKVGWRAFDVAADTFIFFGGSGWLDEVGNLSTLVEEAPEDGNPYVRLNGQWFYFDTTQLVTEAPADGTPYVRQNSGWVAAPTGGTGGGIEDAPEDSKKYVRQGGTWVEETPHIGVDYAFSVLSYGTTVSINWGLAQNFSLTLTGDCTIANPAGVVEGTVRHLILGQDVTGGHSVTFGSAYRFHSETAPTISSAPNQRDVYQMLAMPNGEIAIYPIAQGIGVESGASDVVGPYAVTIFGPTTGSSVTSLAAVLTALGHAVTVTDDYTTDLSSADIVAIVDTPSDGTGWTSGANTAGKPVLWSTSSAGFINIDAAWEYAGLASSRNYSDNETVVSIAVDGPSHPITAQYAAGDSLTVYDDFARQYLIDNECAGMVILAHGNPASSTSAARTTLGAVDVGATLIDGGTASVRHVVTSLACTRTQGLTGVGEDLLNRCLRWLVGDL